VKPLDLLDMPHDSRIVHNKKYNDRVKLCNNDNTFKATSAEEVQTVCSMVTYNDFVLSVTMTHACVPCVTLYNSRQLAELKSFCLIRITAAGCPRTRHTARVICTSQFQSIIMPPYTIMVQPLHPLSSLEIQTLLQSVRTVSCCCSFS